MVQLGDIWNRQSSSIKPDAMSKPRGDHTIQRALPQVATTSVKSLKAVSPLTLISQN